jgi:predicted amidohydrolase YtcJ
MNPQTRRPGPAAGVRCAACLALALALALPLSSVAATTAGRPADLILVGGTIRTLDAADSVVPALAVRDGRVLATGSETVIRALAGARTTVVDLHGRTATPGLIDAHAHLAEGGVDAIVAVDLSSAASIDEVRRRVAARVATLAPGEWVIGAGWDEGKFAERRLVVARDLDPVAPRNPVWLRHTTGHYGVANTAALALARVGRETPDPPAGTIDRDSDGAPTGVLKEAAQALVDAHVPAPTPAQWQAAILSEIDAMHREGMTAVKDPAVTPEQWAAYESLAREGKLGAHVCALWHSEPSLDAARALATRLAALPRPPAEVAPNLVACGVKIFMDGSGGARTAWMYEDWYRAGQVERGNRGYPALDPALYRQLVAVYHGAGLHVATHAIGDRAIDWVVDTYAAVLEQEPRAGLRHAIIHANTPTDHALDLMATLERRYDAGYPETQGEFAWWIGDNYAGNLGPARAPRLNPFRSYVARGIHFANGSDFPVTPLPARLGFWASLARRPLNGTYGTQPFGTAEAPERADVLRSYTVWAAHQLFLEARAGALAPGLDADIAVWDRDPLGGEMDALKDMRCELTLFHGAIVHRAPGTPVAVREHR